MECALPQPWSVVRGGQPKKKGESDDRQLLIVTIHVSIGDDAKMSAALSVSRILNVYTRF
ncbi:MAG: hypothetical protein AAF433_09780 [Bacteroidota bacterium]